MGAGIKYAGGRTCLDLATMSSANLWIFEDQLTPDHPALRAGDKSARVFMVESATHFRQWPFHKIRLAFLISAMRHFARELREAGWTVDYYSLRDKPYRDSLSAIKAQIRKSGSKRFIVARPNDHHTQAWIRTLDIELDERPHALFLTQIEEFSTWARSLKSPVMEHFYRKMRKTHGVLMEGANPVGGEWNLDKLNRKSPTATLKGPPVPTYEPDEITRQAIEDVNRVFADHYGSLDHFALPVTRDDAQSFFKDFLKHRLPKFGEFEDAMKTGEATLYHSRISQLLNVGLLEPMSCIRAAEAEYAKGRAPLNSVEGFIRQILGWREYVFGIYQTFMPQYRSRNTRKSMRPLPQFFWTGDTKMNCLRQVITQVVDEAYSHHIQRLMILCNFATLSGLGPQEVNDWFLAMYVDSHDWVVTPNVVGMGMNADDNTIATKPYISSANYINKMSDYCAGCAYNPNERTGEEACPFNYLYWTFLKHFGKTFSRNPRMTMMLKNVDRIDADEMKQMMSLRKRFIEGL